MKIFTVGFTKKTARDFFALLRDNQIKKVVDIRLNNVSQLAGFSKGEDLKYFLKEICNIGYIHNTDLAPNKKLLDDYKNKNITWLEYEQSFKNLLDERNVKGRLNLNLDKDLDGI